MLKPLILIGCLCFYTNISVFPYHSKYVSYLQDQNFETIFNKAQDLSEQRKYKEALVEYEKCLELSPEDSSSLYNGGLSAYFTKEYNKALKLWSKLKELDPDDWQVRAKLIQTYQAIGDKEKLEAERKQLFELRKTNEELQKQKHYCREQLEVNGKDIMVFEDFELKGDRAIRYYFAIIGNDKDKEEYHISLGSYDFTNEAWKRTNKPKEGERLFHLDKYFQENHETYGFFTPEPSYDEVREVVIRILEGKVKPVSGTYVQQNK